MTRIKRVESPTELAAAFDVRFAVFVDEQGVPPNLERDAFDDHSVHYVAIDSTGSVVGTARWRETGHGIKLERFAVLNKHRHQGVGTMLLKTILDELRQATETSNRPIVLHAQIDAAPFYAKNGFHSYGDPFEEAGIVHIPMRWSPVTE